MFQISDRLSKKKKKKNCSSKKLNIVSPVLRLSLSLFPVSSVCIILLSQKKRKEKKNTQH